MPRSDTYIEKDSAINEQIDRMRHSATRALLERDDVIIVASVSCIYGIGSVETYSEMTLPTLEQGHDASSAPSCCAGWSRSSTSATRRPSQRGMFRAKGDVVEIFPSHMEDRAWRLSMFGDEIESIQSSSIR